MPIHVGGAATLDEAVAYSLQIGPAARAMVDARDELKPALEAALRSTNRTCLRSYCAPMR